MQGSSFRALPFWPLWHGFLVNTVVYGTALGVALFAPDIVKRSLRRRRNLCPRCAYPRGEAARCSECGNVL